MWWLPGFTGTGWHGGATSRAMDLQFIGHRLDSWSGTAVQQLRQVIHTHASVSKKYYLILSVWMAVTPCSWEGDCGPDRGYWQLAPGFWLTPVTSAPRPGSAPTSLTMQHSYQRCYRRHIQLSHSQCNPRTHTRYTRPASEVLLFSVAADRAAAPAVSVHRQPRCVASTSVATVTSSCRRRLSAYEDLQSVCQHIYTRRSITKDCTFSTMNSYVRHPVQCTCFLTILWPWIWPQSCGHGLKTLALTAI